MSLCWEFALVSFAFPSTSVLLERLSYSHSKWIPDIIIFQQAIYLISFSSCQVGARRHQHNNPSSLEFSIAWFLRILLTVDGLKVSSRHVCIISCQIFLSLCDKFPSIFSRNRTFNVPAENFHSIVFERRKFIASSLPTHVVKSIKQRSAKHYRVKFTLRFLATNGKHFKDFLVTREVSIWAETYFQEIVLKIHCDEFSFLLFSNVIKCGKICFNRKLSSDFVTVKQLQCTLSMATNVKANGNYKWLKLVFLNQISTNFKMFLDH